MATFWTWWVRNPFAVLAVISAASGFAGVADWSITLMATLALALIADAGHHLRRKARARARKAYAASQGLREAQALRERLVRPSSSPGTRRTAA